MGKSMAWLYRYNLWANRRLLEACAALPEAELDRTAPGTFGTVRDTLVHLFAAEQRYVEALTQKPNPESPRESQGFPGFDYLLRSAEYSGNALIQVAESTDYDAFCRGVRRGEPFELPAAVLLVQAIHHAQEHRNHIVTILSPLGHSLPDLDGWSFDSEVRAVLAQDSGAAENHSD